MNVVRRTPRTDVEHDFALTNPKPGPYEAEAIALGCRIHRLSGPWGKIGWLPKLHSTLRQGKYDVIHSHSHYYTGLILPVAALAGVRGRISHTHTLSSNYQDRNLLETPYRLAMRASIWMFKTLGIANSQASATDFFGDGWRQKSNVQLLLYGFDFSKFKNTSSRAAAMRKSWGVPPSVPVLGNVARFVPFKNHTFLLDVYAEARKRCPDARLVLIGSGPLEQQLRGKVEALGLQSGVVFAGETDDIPGAMSAMDVFLLPSWSEGLGIVTVEAQAAGLRCLITDTMPVEVDVSPDAISRMPLSAGAAAWSARAIELAQAQRRDASAALDEILGSPFEIDRCINDLNRLYRSQLPVHSKVGEHQLEPGR